MVSLEFGAIEDHKPADIRYCFRLQLLRRLTRVPELANGRKAGAPGGNFLFSSRTSRKKLAAIVCSVGRAGVYAFTVRAEATLETGKE